MKLVQDTMFGDAEVVADFTPAPVTESKPFDMVAWGKSIGGLWEQVQAAKKQAEQQKVAQAS